MSANLSVNDFTLIEMAEEKVCADLSNFSEFVWLVAQGDNAVEPCKYFGPISTDRLISEIVLNRNANDQQLAEGVRELRRRYLAEYSQDVSREFSRLDAESRG